MTCNILVVDHIDRLAATYPIQILYVNLSEVGEFANKMQQNGGLVYLEAVLCHLLHEGMLARSHLVLVESWKSKNL